MSGKCGGMTDERQADAEVQKIADEVRAKAEEKAGESFAAYNAVKYTSQVVAGTNFYIKVDVGGDKCVHLKVFRGLPHTGSAVTLTDLQTRKTLGDPIEFF